MIQEIIKNYKLTNKVKFIVTDNGANKCKAVRSLQKKKKEAAQKKKRLSKSLQKNMEGNVEVTG